MSTTRDQLRAGAGRRGFTLVELLVTISIIAILASLVLVAMFSAQESARVSKTQSTIAKLHGLIMTRWESYRTRRLPIQVPPNATPAQAAALRLNALRELMRYELPDRYVDIADAADTSKPRLVPQPAVSRAYQRRYGNPTNDTYMDAECLYIIITTPSGEDAGGRELFHESEIGDKDADGRLEFWDAWGNPIAFLRWAPGFVSELQPADNNGNRDLVNNHDPFDPLRLDSEAFALYPLIYSPGPDQEYEILVSRTFQRIDQNTGVVKPYLSTDSTPAGLIGAPLDEFPAGDHVDNIHNHLLGTR